MKLMLANGNLRDAMVSRHIRLSDHAGRVIRRLRELRGVSQGELARAAAANLSYVSTVESGKNNISIRKAQALCNALRVSPACLAVIQVRLQISERLDSC